MNLPLRPEVEKAFEALLELPEGEQEPFLAREYAHNPELGGAQYQTKIGPRLVGRGRLTWNAF
jgi:hypothetical protein